MKRGTRKCLSFLKGLNITFNEEGFNEEGQDNFNKKTKKLEEINFDEEGTKMKVFL